MTKYKNCLLYYATYDTYDKIMTGTSDECLQYFNNIKKYILLSKKYWETMDDFQDRYWSEYSSITQEDLEAYNKKFVEFSESLDYYKELSGSPYYFYDEGVEQVFMEAYVDGNMIDVSVEMGIHEERIAS